MAGHSHSANIAIRKGAVDKKRGALFGRLSKAIIIAAKHGGPDPAHCPRLRLAIDKARKQSMPKDNIERAIKRGCGNLEGENYEELLYEGYGPGGIAVMCDILTESRNRTAGEVRKIFEIHGGNLGATNCVSWMFDRKGYFTIPAQHVSEEKLLEVALEAGADDVLPEDKLFVVLCDPLNFDAVSAAFESAKIPTDVAEIRRVAKNIVDLDLDNARRALDLIDALEENEDVQSVTSNDSIPDEILAVLNAERSQ
ncbi:MAG: YebC/PmpR family DNA-binding transcriptional regulator [Planctomycetales bacterium]|nr:YebC/PmpR family DNA-binding transcriptional regulator [Planctomycetales bacterium]